MAEEIDDNGFYREDFTTESGWEILNSQLSELFQKWELANSDWGQLFQPNELFNCKWTVKRDVLDVKGNQVVVEYHRAELASPDYLTTPKASHSLKSTSPVHEDLLSLANTFPPPFLGGNGKHVHYLARYYGLRRFVVLNPSSDENNFITERSLFNFYLSAISVVAAEICATVPIFVQIYDQKWNFFLGIGLTSFMRTNFDLVALEEPPPDYCYLSGLLTMFKEKLPKNCKQPALVSVRTTYELDTPLICERMYVPFGTSTIVNEEGSIISMTHFTALPHGFSQGSRTDAFAVFTWPELTDNMVIDSAMQTQFLPIKAPCGEVHQIVKATSYLISCIKDFHNLMFSSTPLELFLDESHQFKVSEAAHLLEKLTTPQPYRHNRSSDEKRPGQMHERELYLMMSFLLPDLHPNEAVFPYEYIKWSKDPHRIKSATADSLVHRLSCLLATCHAHFGGSKGMVQLWANFLSELRLLWELGIPIPGVSKGFPDVKNTCLLHQKLQMLNVCIERRMRRQRDKIDNEEEEDISDTEEFFDCYEDNVSSSPVKEATKPEGRLKRLSDLQLLNSEQYLYVPITQEPVPKTEDQLQQDTDVMLKCGSDSELVTAIMCSTLQSDMEAFKAANLNACFEDFIRWYSPNDWEEYVDDENTKQYKLSGRMSVEGNTWQVMWQEAKAVPASRQKPLFDDTMEALKVLDYLGTCDLGDIFGLTIVPLLHSAILKLMDIFQNSFVLDLFSELLDETLADLSRYSRDIEIKVLPYSLTSSEPLGGTSCVLQLGCPLKIINKIERLELQFYHFKCFQRTPALAGANLQQIKKKFKDILQNKGVCTLTPKYFAEGNNADGKTTEIEERLIASFKGDMENRLISKEYVMRVGEGLVELPEGQQDKENVKPVAPQFLRAIVTGGKLRLCGAFTENTTFLN